MSNPVSCETYENYCKMSSAENFNQSAKSLTSRKHAYIILTPLNPTFI